MQNKAEQFEFHMTMAELELLMECVEYARQGMDTRNKMDKHSRDVNKLGQDLQNAKTVIEQNEEQESGQGSNVIEVDFVSGCVVNG